MGIDLRYAFRRAWRITWQNRGLWLFGLLAALSSRLRPAMGWANPPPEIERLIERVTASSLFELIAALLFLASVAVALGVTFLNALGKSALVDQVYRIEDGHRLSPAGGWATGRAQARSVFFIILLLGLPIFVLMGSGLVAYLIAIRAIAPSLPESLGHLPAVTAGAACLAPSLCLGVILAIPLGILQRLAVVACVLESRSPWESVTHGWEVLRDNPGPVLGVWMIVAMVSLGVAVIVGAPCGALTLGLRASQWFTSQISLTLALGSTLLFWAISLAVNAILETFRTALWTLAYRQLTGMGRRGG